MLINKEDFIKYIQSIEDQYTYYCELGKLLSDEIQEKVMFTFDKPHAILSEAMFTKEQQDWINWWLWDAPKDSKGVSVPVDGKRITYDLLTVEALYEFLKLYYPVKPKRKHVSALQGIYKRATTNV